MGAWDGLRWFVVLHGIADAWLWGFDTDLWRLRCGSPACGALAILPVADGERAATIDDASWLADVLAFDHDAPVGMRPARLALDDEDAFAPDGDSAHRPIAGRALAVDYWDSLSIAYTATAELRFGESYVLRYNEEPDAPGLDFAQRFAGREEAVSLYAMAARQADVLAEYLCLYRVLEYADGQNGRSFAAAELPDLLDHSYGTLLLAAWHPGQDTTFIDVFHTYKTRAEAALARLRADGVADVGHYLYQLRNSLAHGKRDIVVGTHGNAFQATVTALPIVKLLARRAVEPT